MLCVAPLIMAFLPVEIILIILEMVPFEFLIPSVLSPWLKLFGGFNCFVDYSQLAGLRGNHLLSPGFLMSIVSSDLVFSMRTGELILQNISFLLDSDTFDFVYGVRLSWWLEDLFDKRGCEIPGLCYRSLISSCYEPLVINILGLYPLATDVKALIELLKLSRGSKCVEKKCHKVLRNSWLTCDDLSSNIIHVKPWEPHSRLIVGSSFFFEIKYSDMTRIGGPVKVSLTEDGIEDDVLSLLGGTTDDLSQSKSRVNSWRDNANLEFQRSCELRFTCLEESLEKILGTLENRVEPLRKQSVTPSDSASRIGESRRLVKSSVLPIIEEVAPTEFSLLHPGWNSVQFESDLALATGCSGVVDDEVVGLPDPGAGGLVPSITIDTRLNFLIRLHTALFKLLSEEREYPGEDFLRKFKELRDEKLNFDHPSLDLLEIVLEDTVDWRRYIVKRNLFKIPGFHPGLKLTERIIGNSLLALREEYKSRWNSLLGDCVLPDMLSESSKRWSDNRKKMSEERDRTHKVNSRRKTSDERSTHRSKTGWSKLSSL